VNVVFDAADLVDLDAMVAGNSANVFPKERLKFPGNAFHPALGAETMCMWLTTKLCATVESSQAA
jgi:hypothetical protein